MGMNRIQDKLILITGGANGIGRLMSMDFAGRGARVVVWDLDGDSLKAIEEESRGKGFFVKGMICDVSDRAAVYRQAEMLERELGPVDILVNNAGVVSGTTLLNTPDEKIIRTMNVNTLASFWTCKAFLPAMIKRNSGHVVTVASAAGIIGVTGLADYCASKFAIFGLDEALRMELRSMKSAIRTTVVCPFFINTGMFDGVKTRFPLLLPILEPSYAARRIVQAVLKKRKRLIMPWLVNWVLILRCLPVGVLDFVADFLCISHSMDNFKGRKA
jgi:all-trans-retinol dehydrogenase (NAD+)